MVEPRGLSFLDLTRLVAYLTGPVLQVRWGSPKLKNKKVSKTFKKKLKKNSQKTTLNRFLRIWSITEYDRSQIATTVYFTETSY